MMGGKVYILLVLFFSFSQIYARKSGFTTVVSSLADFQTSSGGFQLNKESPASLEATSYGLFLSSLYGIKDKIADVDPFIESLHRNDGGFANTADASSDLTSIRFALLSISHLRGSAPTSPLTFLPNLYSEDKKLFANKVGGEPDIKSTAFALQSYDLLGDVTSTHKAAIKETLEKNVKSEKGKYFAFSEVNGNYYGILAAKYVDFSFGESASDWALWIKSKQVTSGPNKGGFYSDDKHTEVSIESTALAVSALASLPGNHVNEIDTHALLEYVSNIPHDLKAAAFAYIAIAHTSAFHDLFKADIFYEVLENRVGIVGNRIIQGTQIKPVVNVKSVLLNTAHAGLDIGVSIHPSNPKSEQHLKWNAETQRYVAEEFYPTSGQLGSLTITYKIQYSVGREVEIPITQDITEHKTIGYNIKVSPTATLADRAVEVEQVVGDGTHFHFKVSLSTYDRLEPYDITFSVLDSSNVVIHTETKSAQAKKESEFEYTLSTANVPTGNLNFKFEVSNPAGVHTTSFVTYKLDIKMIATDISFADKDPKTVPTYQINQVVKVYVTPASFPDLSTVKPFDANTASQRKFVMEVSSPIKVLHSVEGKAHGNRYLFELPIAANFDSVGTNIVSFLYVPTSGDAITITPYSETEEDSDELKFIVKANLVVDTEKGKVPQPGELKYGDDISFNFKVKDTISGQYVWVSQGSDSVLLALKHEDEFRSKPFTSTRHPAQVTYSSDGKPQDFAIKWEVSPNTLKGQGFLELIAQGADNVEIPLLKDKKQWNVSVTIGGDIKASSRIYATSVDGFDESVIAIPFDLTCNNKPLPGALLKASIYYDDNTGAHNEVEVDSSNVVRTSDGAGYQVSWRWDSTKIKGGRYVVKFYREIDRVRAVETKEFLQKQLLRKQAEQRRREEQVTEEDVKDVPLEPLFSLDFEFYPELTGTLPIRTEFLVLVLFIISVITLAIKKSNIEGVRKLSSKKKQY